MSLNAFQNLFHSSSVGSICKPLLSYLWSVLLSTCKHHIMFDCYTRTGGGTVVFLWDVIALLSRRRAKSHNQEASLCLWRHQTRLFCVYGDIKLYPVHSVPTWVGRIHLSNLSNCEISVTKMLSRMSNPILEPDDSAGRRWMPKDAQGRFC